MENRKPILIGGSRAARNWCYENHVAFPRGIILVQTFHHLLGTQGPIDPVWLHDWEDLRDARSIFLEVEIINARYRYQREHEPK